MRVGVDFDNTIVRYDRVFHQAAAERDWIPPELAVTKEAVRDYLRSVDREDEWTELQGFVYGSAMDRAEPFDGVQEFFAWCRRERIDVFIISHKTLRPFRGPQYDLHASAWGWLRQMRFFEDPIGMVEERVFFEQTKSDKLARIGRCACTHFIDDLPEFLGVAGFPAQTRRILFDPAGKQITGSRFDRAGSWDEVRSLLGSSVRNP